MIKQLEERSNLFINNTNKLKKAFFFTGGLMHQAISLIFTVKNIDIDIEKMKQCECILKEQTKTFSSFRSFNKLFLVSKMYLAENAYEYLEKVNRVYNKFVEINKFGNRNYYVLCAMNIVENADEIEYEYAVNRTFENYNKIKKFQRFAQITFASILAISKYDIDSLLEESNEIYQGLKKNFFDKNSLKSLCLVLSLQQEDAKQKIDKIINLLNALKEVKCKYGKGIELPSVAALLSINMNDKELAYTMFEVEKFIRYHRGFGNFALNPKTRRMFAAQIIVSALSNGEQLQTNDTISMNTSLSIAIAAQTAIMTACIASTMVVINSN